MVLRPMLKFASRIPDDHEVILVWEGQSNAAPNGTQAEAFPLSPHLNLGKVGIDLTGIVIGTGSGTETMAVTTVLEASEWVGAELRLGTPAAPVVGYGTVTANAAGTITVTWSKDAATDTVDGYLVRRDGQFASYDNVRVLMPYQPDQSGSYPTAPVTIPGYTVPESVEDWEDAAVFLPFSFLEGVEGYGFCEAVGSGGAATAAGATTFDYTTAKTAGVVAGGYVRVEHATGVSWARIGDNTANQLTGLTKGDDDSTPGWSGAGTPTGTEADWKYEVWLPHYLNNPAHLTPGVGFRYPSNQHQPAGAIRNRPRGNTTAIYGTGMGAMISWASQIAIGLGRRVNVVELFVGSSGVLPQHVRNQGGYQGTWGWWSYLRNIDWSPGSTNDCFARLVRMVTTMAQAALVAEGSTKKAKVYAIGSVRGELDAASTIGRVMYSQTFPGLITAYRDRFTAAGMSPYSASAKIPAVAPKLATSVASVLDTELLVPAAVAEWAAKDGFGATFSTDTLMPAGEVHYPTVGELGLAYLMGELSLGLIERALAQGSDARVVDLCNLALAHVGHDAKVTSIDPATTTEEKLCAQFYPLARDGLLEMHRWAFAVRRVALTALAESPTTSWAYAYGVPADALQPFTVLPPEATDDYMAPPASSTGLDVDSLGLSPQKVPVQFQVEDDGFGNRILLANVEDAVLRYTARVVDVGSYSAQFKTALSYMLASKLAGPLVGGSEGRLVAERMLGLAQLWVNKATQHDGTQRQIQPQHIPPWVSDR